MLTQKRLKQLLNYDPETGKFTRKVKSVIHPNLELPVGSSTDSGYITICIKGYKGLAHRLAWLYVYGYIPENDIDHINRIKTDNRINNLREVSRQCNLRNTGNRKNNTSGVKGVSFNKKSNKWQVSIAVNNKLYYLGRFDDFIEAVCHRLAAEQCLNWNGCDSNSPAYQYVMDYLWSVNKT